MGFPSKVLSHSHRAFARWPARAEIARNRFKGNNILDASASRTGFETLRRQVCQYRFNGFPSGLVSNFVLAQRRFPGGEEE
jgi:hypothetical protein